MWFRKNREKKQFAYDPWAEKKEDLSVERDLGVIYPHQVNDSGLPIAPSSSGLYPFDVKERK